MYRNNARDGRDMISARRLISKRVTKTSLFRRVLENEGFEVPKKRALGLNEFWFSGIFWVEMG